MDLAIVLDLRPQPRRAAGLLERPFGEGDLIELALEKLAALDAPAAKTVLAADADDRARVRAHPGLRPLRQAGTTCDLERPRASFAPLRGLARNILWLNPHYPLVAAERWWEAAERLHAEGRGGLVSACRLKGPFLDPQRGGWLQPRELLAARDAFMIFAPADCPPEGGLFREAPIHFEVDANEARAVDNGHDLAAVEAVFLRTALSLPV